MNFTQRDEIILKAIQYFRGVWPKELTSGVMFFAGERITIQEFVNMISRVNKLFSGV